MHASPLYPSQPHINHHLTAQRRFFPLLFLASLLLVLSWASSVFAQSGTGSVVGRVQDPVTGVSLENVRVSVKGTTIVAMTDVSGQYQLDRVPAGPVVLRFFYTGREEQEVTVTVTDGGRVEQDFALPVRSEDGGAADRTITLSEFVVQSAKETNASVIAVNEQRTSRNIISVVSADEFGTIVDNNAGELLKNLPGMDVEYFGGTIVAVSVRGLGAANTEMNFDGMPVASANAEATSRGFEVQHSSAADIARVEVRKVPLPEDSANSVGGSINMIRRSAFEKSRREISYRAFLISDGDWLTTRPMDGPKDQLHGRWRPNFNVTWTEPISKKLGFALTFGRMDMINNVRWDSPSWNIGSAANFTAAQTAIQTGQPVPAVPSLYNPALQTVGFSNAPYRRGSSYVNFRTDWRPVRELTLKGSVNFNRNFKDEPEETRFRLNSAATGSGNVSRYNDPSQSLGRVGGGAVRHENIKWRDHDAPAFNVSLGALWKKRGLELSTKFTWSRSRHIYRDVENGFFESASVGSVDGLITPGQLGVGAGTANPIPLTIDFYNFDYWTVPGRIDVRTTASGAASSNIADYTVPVDWQNPAVWRLGAASSRPGRAQEIVTSSRSYAKYAFGFRVPLDIQLGFDFTERFRNRSYIFESWNFVGADGVANSADDNAAPIIFQSAGPRASQPPYHPQTPQRVSMARYYQLYQANPNWFVYDAERSLNLGLRNNAAYELTETVYAPYLQFNTRLLNNRLQMTGGVRREYVRGQARGLGTRRDNAYMKYADGSIVRSGDLNSGGAAMVTNAGSSTNVNYRMNFDPSVIPTTRAGSPIFLPEVQAAGNQLRAQGRTTDSNTNLGRGTLVHTNLVYSRLGARNESDQEKDFPSLHANYNITQNLVLQGAYALTMAKLDYEDYLIPSDDQSDTLITDGPGAGALGRLTLSNPDLKPWVADIYEVRLAYYTNSGGSVSVGVNRRNVSNFIAQIDTAPLTAEDLEEWRARFPEKDLSTSLIGYTIRTNLNEGSSRLEGADIEGRQNVGQIVSWLKGVSVGGSMAYSNRRGANTGNLGRNRTWRGTANIAYSIRRLGLRLNYSMNGEMIENAALTNTAAPGVVGRQLLLQQDVFDVQATYRITRWAELFANAGNVTGELRVREQQMPGRPKWGSMTSSSVLGTSFAVGIQGTF